MTMEGKKRTRPTMAQVRALEAEVAELKMLHNVDGCYDKKLEHERDMWKAKFEEQLDGTSKLVADCDGWRDDYRVKCKEAEKAEKAYKKILDANVRLGNENEELLKEIKLLKHRSFWARVFNKGV